MNVHTRTYVRIGISGCTDYRVQYCTLRKENALQTLLGCLRKCPDF